LCKENWLFWLKVRTFWLFWTHYMRAFSGTHLSHITRTDHLYFTYFFSLATLLLSSMVNFINVLQANFTYESLFGSFFYLHVTREKLLKTCSYKKFTRKMLMKLTLVQACLYIHTFLNNFPDWRDLLETTQKKGKTIMG